MGWARRRDCNGFDTRLHGTGVEMSLDTARTSAYATGLEPGYWVGKSGRHFPGSDGDLITFGR